MPLRPANASVTGESTCINRANRVGRASSRIVVLWFETLPETVDVAPVAEPPPPPPPQPIASAAMTRAPALADDKVQPIFRSIIMLHLHRPKPTTRRPCDTGRNAIR